MKYEKIKTIDEVIKKMKQLYVFMQKQQSSYKREGERDEKLEKELESQLEKNLDDLMNGLDTKSKEVEFLKNRIEYIFADDSIVQLQEDRKAFFEKYYQELLETLNRIEKSNHQEEILINSTKESEVESYENEKILLKLIEETGVEIYEDKEEQPSISYGDFIKRKEEKEAIYSNSIGSLNELSRYSTNKLERRNQKESKICAKVQEDETLSKYEFEIEYEPGRRVSTKFFGESLLGEKIKNGEMQYFSPMLAAVLKAKQNGREHIGRISLIDKELETFITSYDDNLENSVKQLVLKEQQQSKSNKVYEKNNDERNSQ